MAGGRSYSQYVQEFNTYVGEDYDGLRSLTVGFAIPHQSALYDSGQLSTTVPDDPPRHLYALQVEDLLEFTTDDLEQAWEFRSHSCGSKEAAAELYALIRVLDGIDEFYTGASAYQDHPEVMAIFAVPDQQGLTDQVKAASAAVDDPMAASSADAAGLTLAAVSELTVDELRKAWDNRPESFASLEAAAETLAILRSLNAEAPEKPNYQRMLRHELVLELEDALPSEIQAQAPAAVPAAELALLKVDRRAVRSQVAVIRPGQGNFRTAMLERYGGECCITGCTVDTLLEAAHIIPYRGDQSNDVTNGLLLRVDIHRLFDAHLITINPRSLTVEVAGTFNDAGYQAYHGKRPFTLRPKPRILFLEAHYQAYTKARLQP